MTKGNILEIDGSFGEGGGAILRIAAGFSYLFNQPIQIKNIRANRPKPGLRMQHLMGLKALTELFCKKFEVGNILKSIPRL